MLSLLNPELTAPPTNEMPCWNNETCIKFARTFLSDTEKAVLNNSVPDAILRTVPPLSKSFDRYLKRMIFNDLSELVAILCHKLP